jgi:hypothetical protein
MRIRSRPFPCAYYGFAQKGNRVGDFVIEKRKSLKSADPGQIGTDKPAMAAPRTQKNPTPE